MHDIARARSIVNAVLRSAKKQDADAIIGIDIVIGPLTMLSPEQLRFWIGELLKDTPGEGADITIDESTPEIECNECGYSGPVTVENDPLYHLMSFSPSCPDCGSDDVTVNAGDECVVRKMQVRQ